MARTAISPRLAISTVLNMALSLSGGAAGDKGAPAAEFGDVLGGLQRPWLADETLDPAAVFQLQVADAQRRRDFRDELTEARERDVPQLDDDRTALSRLHQPRFGRHRAGQGIEAIAGRGEGLLHQHRIAGDQLEVQRHPGEVGSDHRDPHAARRLRRRYWHCYWCC